jgi:hypothetical protein
VTVDCINLHKLANLGCQSFFLKNRSKDAIVVRIANKEDFALISKEALASSCIKSSIWELVNCAGLPC